jgi:hypothetical protein
MLTFRIRAALINTVLSQYKSSDFGIAHIFCSYTERKVVTSTTLLASIARQLLERKPIVPKNILDLYKNLQGKKPSSGEYLLITQGLVSSFRGTLIFVDAIDECSEEVREIFLSILDSLGPAVRLFITSRPDSSLTLRGATLTKFKGDTNDFKAYLNHRMLRENFIKRFTGNHPALHIQVRDTIAERADGM